MGKSFCPQIPSSLWSETHRSRVLMGDQYVNRLPPNIIGSNNSNVNVYVEHFTFFQVGFNKF